MVHDPQAEAELEIPRLGGLAAFDIFDNHTAIFPILKVRGEPDGWVALAVPGGGRQQVKTGMDYEVCDRAGTFQEAQLTVAAVFGLAIKSVTVALDPDGVVLVRLGPAPI